jgi:hypothetical protein
MDVFLRPYSGVNLLVDRHDPIPHPLIEPDRGRLGRIDRALTGIPLAELTPRGSRLSASVRDRDPGCVELMDLGRTDTRT